MSHAMTFTDWLPLLALRLDLTCPVCQRVHRVNLDAEGRFAVTCGTALMRGTVQLQADDRDVVRWKGAAD